MTLKEYLKGKNREEFAKEMGVSRGYIDQLVVGMRKPSTSLAAKIYIATNGRVNLLELLYPDGVPRAPNKEADNE